MCNVFVIADAKIVYTISLHDALPISCSTRLGSGRLPTDARGPSLFSWKTRLVSAQPERSIRGKLLFLELRSEEHTSELQSHSDLVCRLLLEKKNRHKEAIPVIDHLIT